MANAPVNQLAQSIQAEQAKQAGLGAPQSLNAEAALSQSVETPEQTMARLKASFAASGQLTGAARQAQIERAAGIGTKLPDLPAQSSSVTPSSIPTPVVNPLQTTSGLRAEGRSTAATANDYLNTINKATGLVNYGGIDDSLYTPFNQTEAGKSASSNLSAIEQQMQDLRSGRFTPGQQAEIESAMKAAEARYAPLIRESEQAKQSGLPKSVIAAGERGGLLNTQFAGAAALLPTQGGNFIGAGGELERIQSQYDQNISNAKDASMRAIEEARQSAIEAITTGESENLANAQKAYERAQQAHNEGLALAQEKQKAVMEWSKTQQDLAKFQRESADKTIDAIAKSGTTNVPDWYFDQLDQQAGYNPGTSQLLYDTASAEYGGEAKGKEIEQATKLIDVLNKIPTGQSVRIGNSEYYGIKQADVDWKMEVGDDGNAKGVTFNKTTGEFDVQDLGYIGSKNAGFQLTFNDKGEPFNYNPKTGQLFYAGQSGTNWNQVVPEGTPFDWYDPSTGKNFTGQCGEFIRWGTDGAIQVGNSLDEKLKIVDSTIGSDANPVQVGDVMVQGIGGPTGHIAFVNSVTRAPDGSTMFRLTEANYGKDGLITNTRQVSSTDKTVRGFARPSSLNPALNVGTDTPVFGTKGGTSNKPITSEEIAKTPEAVKLGGIADLKRSINNYRSLIEKYGAASGLTPSARQKLDSAREGINLSVKTAEGLGALQAPDIELVSRMIPDVTTEGFVNSLIPRPFTASRALETIDQLLSQYSDKSDLLYRQLISRGTEYVKDPYIRELARELNLTDADALRLEEAKSNLQQGDILVKDKTTGDVFSLPQNEFNSSMYEKL